MDNSDPTALIILSQLVFIFSTLLMGLVGFILFKKRKSAILLKEISQRVADRKAERLNALKKHFSDIPQSSEEQIEAATKEIVTSEINFYQTIINAFAKNDVACMEKLDEEVNKLVEPYKKLVPDGSAVEQKQESSDDSDAIIPDIDDAIDELIGNDETDQADPALDLSKEPDADGETPDAETK